MKGASPSAPPPKYATVNGVCEKQLAAACLADVVVAACPGVRRRSSAAAARVVAGVRGRAPVGGRWPSAGRAGWRRRAPVSRAGRRDDEETRTRRPEPRSRRTARRCRRCPTLHRRGDVDYSRASARFLCVSARRTATQPVSK